MPLKIIENTHQKHHTHSKAARLFSSTAGLLLAGLLLFTDVTTVLAAQSQQERIAVNQSIPVESNEIEGWPDGPVISAKSAVLLEADTGTILYAKDMHSREYPASCTKIMTCLLASEYSAMDEVVTMSKNAIEATPRDSSHIALDIGNELTMEQCLNAILIASANEVSYAVAEHIAGSVEDFVSMMNEKAEELGCLDTHFNNPNGLPDEQHYTTAYDLAQIGRAFFKKEQLSKISRTTLLHLPPTDKQPKNIMERTKNQLMPGQPLEYPYLVGSKTGYTDTARSCLVSCAEKDGMKLICVVLKDEAPLQFQDTATLFDYGFSNFRKVAAAEAETHYNLETPGDFYSDHTIFGSSRPMLSLNQEASIVLPRQASVADCDSSVSYEGLSEGQAAMITYRYHGVEVGKVPVDFVPEQTQDYTFASPMQQADSASQETQSETDFIYINVFHILFLLLALAGLIAGLLLLRTLLGRLPRREKRNRRRDRKRQSLSFTALSRRSASTGASRRAQIRAARRRSQKAGRRNRNKGPHF